MDDGLARRPMGGAAARRPARDALRDLEALFGADLSDLTVREDALRPDDPRAAVALGNIVAFAPGRYAPDAAAGRFLLAHEVCHTLQQRQGRAVDAARSPRVAAALEAEADLAGALAVARMAAPGLGDGALRRARRGPPRAVPQARLLILEGPGAGAYTSANLRQLLDAVAIVINRDYPNIGAREGVLPMVHHGEIYRFQTLDAVARYILQINAFGAAIFVPPPVANTPAPTLEFGEDHGSLHFGGAPTRQKSKWSLDKPAAMVLMEAAIRAHLPRMMRESSLTEPTPWLIVGRADNSIGRYKDDTRDGSETDTYMIQAQMIISENLVSYHGFPDERVVRTGLGRTRNEIV